MKKVLLLGFLFVILIAIPITIYLIHIQTNTKSKAAASTTLSFSQLNGPVNPGQNFNLDIIMDPGTNQVSFVKLIISYDKTMLQRGNPGITPNTTVFPVTLEGPTYDQCTGNTCTMSITLSIGTEVSKAVQGSTPATIASVNFQPLQSLSAGGNTTVSFGNGTQVLSLSSADQPSENVLASTTPAAISIAVPTATPTPTSQPTPTSSTGSTGSPSTTSAPTPIVSVTPSPTGTASATQNPICTSFTADNTTVTPNGSVLFTANGTDPNANGTVNKVTFNFGDGQVQDVTSSGGIGTATVNAQQSHTYTTSGTYTASAILTDNFGNISNPTSCSQTISVSSSIASNPVTPTPVKKLAPTGPGDTLVITGIAGAIIAIIGGVLAFGL